MWHNGYSAFRSFTSIVFAFCWWQRCWWLTCFDYKILRPLQKISNIVWGSGIKKATINVNINTFNTSKEKYSIPVKLNQILVLLYSEDVLFLSNMNININVIRMHRYKEAYFIPNFMLRPLFFTRSLCYKKLRQRMHLILLMKYGL